MWIYFKKVLLNMVLFCVLVYIDRTYIYDYIYQSHMVICNLLRAFRLSIRYITLQRACSL